MMNHIKTNSNSIFRSAFSRTAEYQQLHSIGQETLLVKHLNSLPFLKELQGEGALGAKLTEFFYQKKLEEKEYIKRHGLYISPTVYDEMPITGTGLVNIDGKKYSELNSKQIVEYEVYQLSLEEKNTLREWLPIQYSKYLDKMTAARQIERLAEIEKRFDEKTLRYIDYDPSELHNIAMNAAWKARTELFEYGILKDMKDISSLNTEQKKQVCSKFQFRKLKKKQIRALLYIEAALGAVGGKNHAGRPLYVSDYVLKRFEDHQRRTEESLKNLRLVKVSYPSVQLNMYELDKNAKKATAAKMKLMINLNLKRWKELNWHICWITITLDGSYVPNSTNEEHRASKWNVSNGPMEALDAMQLEVKRAMAVLRDKNVRPSGFWFSQPQQSGVPHRHILLACKTVEDARAVCDSFRDKFSTRLDSDKKGQDRGCAAYVIEDENEEYAPPKGKNGKKETAETLAKYASRYASRYEEEKEDDFDFDDLEETENQSKKAEKSSEHKRFKAWKWSRNTRTHAALGFDSSRSPSKIWDILWKNSKDDIRIFDARGKVACSEMLQVKRFTELVVKARNNLKSVTLTDELKAKVLQSIDELNDKIDMHGWHAAIAAGLWSDTDLDERELNWLQDRLHEEDEFNEVESSLPPVPLSIQKITSYGESRNEISGITFPEIVMMITKNSKKEDLKKLAEEFEVDFDETKSFKKQFAEAEIYFMKRPSGALAAYRKNGESLLRVEDEWKIMSLQDLELYIIDMKKLGLITYEMLQRLERVKNLEEEKRLKEEEKEKNKKKRLVSKNVENYVKLSFNQTDPSRSAFSKLHSLSYLSQTNIVDRMLN